MRWITVTALIATSLPLNLWATDLASVYARALQNDGIYQAAKADLAAQQTLMPQLKSTLLPQVSLSASYTIDQAENPSATVPGEFNTDTQNVTLSLNQAIYNKGLWAGVDQAKALVSQAEANYAVAQQDLILRTADAYFNVLKAQDALAAATAEKEATERQLEQTQKRFEVGLIAITDVHESRANYDLAIAQEIAAINQLDIAKEALEVITGEKTGNLSGLTERLPLETPEPADTSYWVSKAMEQNASLQAARFGAESARETVKQQRSGNYPSLNLNASHSQGSVSGDANFDPVDTQITLALQWDIYTGNRVGAQIDQAQAQFDQAQALVMQAKRDTTRQARASYLNVQAAISSVSALKQALLSTQTAAEATQAGFEVGTRTAVEVLLALRSTFSAERDYLAAQYDYLLNQLRLKQAVGNLGQDDVDAINRWLTKR